MFLTRNAAPESVWTRRRCPTKTFPAYDILGLCSNCSGKSPSKKYFQLIYISFIDDKDRTRYDLFYLIMSFSSNSFEPLLKYNVLQEYAIFDRSCSTNTRTETTNTLYIQCMYIWFFKGKVDLITSTIRSSTSGICHPRLDLLYQYENIGDQNPIYTVQIWLYKSKMVLDHINYPTLDRRNMSSPCSTSAPAREQTLGYAEG